MSFDKIKAMRNAERFLAQGKIRAAINEYKRIVENDSKDFSMLNMLGDLYAKASDKNEAVKCFTKVAEHYSKQGFSQKAIAVYNKISRLVPDSLEVSAKLAELYQQKGSVAEARSHYTALADTYNRTGRKAEALVAWRQIADLDPNNTDIYLKIADACWQDEQKDEAAQAYLEAGNRLSSKKQYESAVAAFSRALEIKPDDLPSLRGIAESQISLGYADEAAKFLEEALERQPYNREIIHLLIDCYLDVNNPQAAEKTVINLVEQEPASYPKFLDVAQAYLKDDQLEAATRILTMTSEHLLVGGQAEELGKWINEILAKNPEQVDALRLLVRYHGWQREEAELKLALERLAEAARQHAAIDDERYALTQLITISPQNTDFAERLQEINETYGHSDVYYESPLQSSSFNNSNNEIPTFESFAILENGENAPDTAVTAGYGEVSPIFADGGETADGNSQNGSNGFHQLENAQSTLTEENSSVVGFDYQVSVETEVPVLDKVTEHYLLQELGSVDFYISQGYSDLAEKTLSDLESRFGKHAEIEKFRASLNEVGEDKTHQNEVKPENIGTHFPTVEIESVPDNNTAQSTALSDFQSELGFEVSEYVEEGDYDTHYQLGIAYKEMGLIEESIKEFQDAIKFTSAKDGTPRLFLCCNLLGHCFMEKQMPNLALMWFKRALNSNVLAEEEIQGLRYEIANAYEKGDDKEKAIEYFEGIYALDINYRDVSKRLQNLRGK